MPRKVNICMLKRLCTYMVAPPREYRFVQPHCAKWLDFKKGGGR